MRDATYDTSDLRLMTLVRLDGREAQRDNTLVWQLLRPLVLDTPGWNYVKQHDATQNGRMAFLTLQTRGEGEAALDARRTAAKETIQKAKFTGKSKRFTLQSYVNLLQGAFTELEACGDDYKLLEKQKVSIFVHGLQADEYAATKHSIFQNPETREDFQKCYSFVETMERFCPSYSDPNSFDRTISDVTRKGGDDWKSPEEWAALSQEEKSRLLQPIDRSGAGRVVKGGREARSQRQASGSWKQPLRLQPKLARPWQVNRRRQRNRPAGTAALRQLERPQAIAQATSLVVGPRNSRRF